MSTLTPESWRAVSPYLEEALGLPESERAAFVASLQRENPAMAGLLQKLLEEHTVLSGERFLEQAPAAFSGLEGLAGQAIGAYTLISPLGQGGMGIVWLAERNDGRFERRAAIKFLSLVLRRGEERFKREGSILGRLAHPHIAELLDAGVSPAGQPYLVLEYVDGEHIDEYCDRRALRVEARIRLFLDVLDAVAHAHAHLIVHRDIKPSNVLVTAAGQVKLLDFGIAKLLEDDGGADAATLLTLEAGTALTPEYAAPEQLTGQPVTTVTDVYALGILFYVLLTGRHPVETTTRSPAELVKAIVEIESQPLPRAAKAAGTEAALARATTPEKLQRALSGELETIAAKALKKNPEERYASVAAFSDDLRRYLNYQPISARPDTLAYRAAKFVRRNRIAVALAALALVAAASGLVGTITQSHAVRAQRDFALRQLSRAEAINDLNSFVLSDAAPSGKPFTVDSLLARAEQIVERQSGTPISRVELLISIGRQYTVQDEYARARPLLEKAYGLSQTLADPSTRAQASCSLAQTLSRQGELERADKLFQQGTHVLPADPIFAMDRANCLLRGSEVARNRGDVQTAIARALAAQAQIRESPYSSDLMELDSQITLASAYSEAGRHREAGSAFGEAAARLRVLGRDDTQMASTVFNNWGAGLILAGLPVEAEKVLRRSIAISRDKEGTRAVPAQSLVNYGRALFDIGRLREAAKYAEQGYEKAQQAGDDAPAGQALLLRAAIYRNEGDLGRAAEMLIELEPRLEQHLPAGHIAFGSLALQQALNTQARGDRTAALRFADQAVAIAESQAGSGGQGRDYLPAFLVRRSGIRLQSGLPVEAAADAAQALDMLERVSKPGTYSSILGRAYLVHGQALQALNRPDQAHADIRLAVMQLQNALGPEHPDTRLARQLANSMR